MAILPNSTKNFSGKASEVLLFLKVLDFTLVFLFCGNLLASLRLAMTLTAVRDASAQKRTLRFDSFLPRQFQI